MRGYSVAHFAQYEHVWIKPEQAADTLGLRESLAFDNLELGHAFWHVFHRVFDRHYGAPGAGEFAHERVKRGRLARAGRSGDEDHSACFAETASEGRVVRCAEAELIHLGVHERMREESQRELFAAHTGTGGDAHTD